MQATGSGQIQTILDQLFGDRRPTRWITRARPKIDRIACPWLIRRFIDERAEFFFVPAGKVFEESDRLAAMPFDIPGARFSHEGERCSFDAFLKIFGLEEQPFLNILAPIVRGADTDRHDLAPEAAGLHAISLGLAERIDDDHALIEAGFQLYDSLYLWASQARHIRHAWEPA